MEWWEFGLSLSFGFERSVHCQINFLTWSESWLEVTHCCLHWLWTLRWAPHWVVSTGNVVSVQQTHLVYRWLTQQRLAIFGFWEGIHTLLLVATRWHWPPGLLFYVYLDHLGHFSPAFSYTFINLFLHSSYISVKIRVNILSEVVKLPFPLLFYSVKNFVVRQLGICGKICKHLWNV